MEIVMKGQIRTTTERLGRALVKMGKASLPEAPAYVTKVIVAEDEVSPRTGKPKRQYKRRDIKAED